MGDGQGINAVASPKYINGWNLNSIGIALAIIILLVGWGATWQRLESDNESTIEELAEQRARIMAIEQSTRTLDNHELRISAHDQALSDLSANNRIIERSIAEMQGDIRVIRQIVEQGRNK